MPADQEPSLGSDSKSAPDGQDSADSYANKSKMLVRLVAGGFLLIGALNLALYWFKSRHDQTALNLWRCLWLSIPLVVGVVILIKTSALAERLDDWLDQ